MQNHDDYVSDRADLLRKYKLGMLLMPRDVGATNPWFMVFEPQLNALVENVGQGSMRFCFSTDPEVQAYAIHKEQAIVLTAGMFDLLCKLAASLVTQGLYPRVGAADCTWDPDIRQNLRSVRQLLTLNTFNWSSAPPWASDPDRLELFFQLLRTMVRFVVLHEAGHLWHRHGERRQDGLHFEVDSGGPRHLPEPEALASQARELLADQFAFRAVLKLQHLEVQEPPANVHAQNVRQAVMPSASEQIAFGLLPIHIYFYAVDRWNWSVGDVHLYSHPPAPFRMKALMVDVLEFGAPGIAAQGLPEIVRQASLTATAAIAASFRRFPDLNWLQWMGDQRMSDHFEQLFEVIPTWQRPAGG